MVKPLSTLVFFLLASILPGLLQAAGPAPSGNAAPIEYTVQPGDTISGLSERFLGGSGRWGAIARINPGLDVDKLRPGQVLYLPEDRVQSVGKTVKVLKINGQAQSAGAELQEGQHLGAGSTIEVADESFVTLELDDGSIVVIEPNTRASISELRRLATGAQRASMRIDKGRVEVKASPQKEPGARFEISTPSATTAVRGTSFRVGETPGGLSLTEVTEGQVSVQGSAGNRRGNRVTVDAGSGIAVAPGQAPGTPEALLPAPDLSALPKQYTQTIIEVAFPPVPHAVAYRITVARDAAFADPVALAQNALPQIKVAGLPDGTYYLRARAVSADGLHGLEAATPFVLHARPEPPFALAPANDKKVAAGVVQLTWSAPQNAVAYDLNIVRGENEVRHIERHVGAAYAFNAEPGSYRWQLATRDADGRLGPFGSWYTFNAVVPPSISDATAGIKEDDNSLTLAWAGTPGQTYHWQIATDSDFRKVELEGNSPEASVTLPMPAAGTYFVRVHATTSEGIEGPYSNPQKIDIPEQDAGFPFWLLFILLPFAL